MSSLSGRALRDTYPNLLQVEGGLSSTLKTVSDGSGTASPIQVSSSAVQINNYTFSSDVGTVATKEYVTSQLSTVSVNPPGSNGQLIYNNAGSFGATGTTSFNGYTIIVSPDASHSGLNFKFANSPTSDILQVFDNSNNRLFSIKPAQITNWSGGTNNGVALGFPTNGTGGDEILLTPNGRGMSLSGGPTGASLSQSSAMINNSGFIAGPDGNGYPSFENSGLWPICNNHTIGGIAFSSAPYFDGSRTIQILGCDSSKTVQKNVMWFRGDYVQVYTSTRYATANPAQITGQKDNYTLDGLFGSYYRLTSDASRTITGLSINNSDGLTLQIWNVGSNNIVLSHENTASTAGNRFLCPSNTDLTLAANDMAILIYDSTTSRFRVRKM